MLNRPYSRSLVWTQILAFVLSVTAPAVAQSVPASDQEPIVVAAASNTSKKKSSSTKTSKSSSSKKKTSSRKSSSSSSKKSEKKAKPTPTPAPPLTLETLPHRLDEIIKSAGSRSDWGVKIVHAESGQDLYGHSEDQHFIPASNRKIFTGALALDQLGPDFKFNSYLYRTGNVDPNGILQGNLVILPQGDPTFSNRVNGKVSRQHSADWIYKDWVDKAKAAGIREVSGDILIDASDWVWNDLQPRGWPDRVRQDRYAVVPGPLTVNENYVGIQLAPGKPGDTPKISFFPDADGYPVKMNAVSGTSGTPRIFRPNAGPIEISGTVSKSYGGAVPVDNPTLFAAAVFRDRLRDAGISLSGTARIVTRKGIVPPPTSETVIALYQSPRMADMVKVMNKESNNHYAEQLFVAISAAKTGKGGYTESLRLENELLQKAGIDTGNLQFGDGCGLSESNKVTPEQVTKLLNYMLQHPAAQAFVDSMAIGGVDGTLRGRMKGDSLQGKVYGKTGTINHVSTLSGYYFKAPGKTYTFSFLVNEIPGSTGGAKATQDRILATLARLQD